jgi:hypothetical protein
MNCYFNYNAGLLASGVIYIAFNRDLYNIILKDNDFEGNATNQSEYGIVDIENLNESLTEV